MNQKCIRVAFFRGDGGFLHTIIRWWTSSSYSHAELILPDSVTWVTISPFFNSRVSLREKNIAEDDKDWEIIVLPFSWREPVMRYQVSQLETFVEDTTGSRYDWIGMILSHVSPFLVKPRHPLT